MKLTGQRNQCPTCGLHFKSTSAFDKHRTGDYGKPKDAGGRRCRTVPEMEEIGMVCRGGWWVGSEHARFSLSLDAKDATSRVGGYGGSQKGAETPEMQVPE